MNALTRILILGPTLVLGCGSGARPGEPSYPSAPSGSYSSPSSPSVGGVPGHEVVTAGLVVRPDLLCLPFAVRVLDPDAEKAMALAQASAEGLAQRLGAVTKGALRMRGVVVSPAYGVGKAKADEPQFAVVVDGAFEVPLPATMDFWARSKLVASLVSASKKEAPGLVFEAPQLRVADPEVHRAKLLQQWVDRARAFSAAAESPSAPLSLTDCALPGDVSQRSISTEEVALTLSVACKLESPVRAAGK